MSAAGRRFPWRSLGRLLAVLVVCLVVGELALRLFHYFRPVYIFESDSFQRFRGRAHGPNYDGSLNAWGFNDRERSVEKPAGAYRILAVGDSFVFGVVPYPGNFVTLLERRLVESGRSVEALNMGIPRTNPEDHMPLLVAEGLRLDPDAVLQFVYVGNDFTDLRVSQRRLTPFTLDLARFLFHVLPEYEGSVFHLPGEYRDDQPTFEAKAYVRVVRRHAAVFDPNWNGFDWRLERLRVALERTAELCRRHGVAHAVVLQPAEIQIDPELAARVGGAALDLERPNRELARALRAAGIPYLDLLPAFAEAAVRERLHKPADSHWNLAGNRLAAEEIQAWLERGASGIDLPPPPG